MMRHKLTWKMVALFYAVVLLVGFFWSLGSTDHPELASRPAVCRWELPHQTIKQKSEAPKSDLPAPAEDNAEIHSGISKTTRQFNNVTFSELWLPAILRGDVMAVKLNEPATSEIRSACVVDPFLDCSNMGLSALLLQTMEALAYCHNTLGSIPTVMWRNCFAVCSRDPNFNSWNWYFEPVNPGVELHARKVVCVANISPESGAPVWLSASFRNRELNGYYKKDLITNETRKAAHKITHLYVKPNREISRVVEELYVQHLQGNNLLGIHVRGTDHISESKGYKLPPIKMWIEEARQILASIPAPSKIFIAADNSEVPMAFKKEFGQRKVFFTKALRAKFYHQMEAPHHYAGTSHNKDPKKFGSEVLVDTLLLAKCQHFLHAEASVSNLAVFFNPNIKSYFLGELSAKKSNLAHKQDHVEPSQGVKLLSTPEEDEVALSEYKQCLTENGATSSCPNMVAAKLSQPLQVQQFLSEFR